MEIGMMDKRGFEFLDLVVDMFAGTSKELTAKAASKEHLEDICYGPLLAACILHAKKLGVKVRSGGSRRFGEPHI